MKYLNFKIFVSIFCLIVVIAFPTRSNDTITDTTKLQKYPYVAVTPSNPIPGKDTVNIQLVVGFLSNACYIPTIYRRVEYKIEESSLPIYPPLYIVKIGYKELPAGFRICLIERYTGEYGPTYNLGILNQGTYKVVNENDTLLEYGTFEVREPPSTPPFTIKGKVYDDQYPLEIMSQPISKAKILIVSKVLPSGNENAFVKDSTYTNEMGEYSLTILSKGIYEMVCSHPDYTTRSYKLNLFSDTTKHIILIPKDANTSLKGKVTIISEEGIIKPVESCSIVVSRSDPNTSAFRTDSNILKTVTDKNGLYFFEKIPITANGEKWFVKASFKDYTSIAKVILSNREIDTVNFEIEYQNKDSVIVDGVIFKTAANKFFYTQEDTVRIRYSITNTTNDTVKLDGKFWDDECEYDLIVRRIEENGVIDPESTIIYKRSENLPCPVKDTFIIIPPGKTKVNDLPWWSIRSKLKRGILRFYVRLIAEKYDYTAVGVNVKIDSMPAVSIEQRKENTSMSIKNNIKITQRGISLHLSKAQTIYVTYYDLKGKAIPQLSFVKNIPSGTTLIPFEKKSISKGLYIVKIKGMDFEKRINTVFLGK